MAPFMFINRRCFVFCTYYLYILKRKPSVPKKVEKEESLSPEEEELRMKKKNVQAALQRQFEDRKDFREKYMILKKISIVQY